MLDIDNTLTIPLTSADHQFVKSIAVQSGCQQEKLKRVIQNLLAVRVVSHWLDIYEIPYDWHQSYIINPLVHYGDEVADIYLPQLGRLECRVAQQRDNIVKFPAETWTDRLGYLIVEISTDLKEGKLIGFLESVQEEWVLKKRLQPINHFFGVLAAAEFRSVPISVPEVVQATFSNVATTIHHWLQEAKANAWQIAEFSILEPSFVPARSLSTVQKVIDKLHNATSETAKQRLIITLGELAKEDNQQPIIAQLVEIINQTNNEDTRWLAAGTLAQIDPQHPQAAHRLKKTISTDLKIVDTPIELIISLMPTQKREIEGIIELKLVDKQGKLPVGIKLTLLSDKDEFIDEIAVEAEETMPKNLLKINLDIEPGTNFRVRVSLNDFVITEDIHL